MSGIKELIRTEADGTLSFGNYELSEKSKRSDYEYQGDLYKVKTFADITKLEKNGLLVYESVPGTVVEKFYATEHGVSFQVTGTKDTQVILGMEEDSQYKVYLDETNIGTMTTNMGGKLVLSVAATEQTPVAVKVVKL